MTETERITHEVFDRHVAAARTDNGVYSYQLYDDADNTCHGTFESETEARGAAAYDRLAKWTIYHRGQIVAIHLKD